VGMQSDTKRPMYVCTGNTAADVEPCGFTTNDRNRALDHWEMYDHDVTEDGQSQPVNTGYGSGS
jgi:hypothetical protein